MSNKMFKQVQVTWILKIRSSVASLNEFGQNTGNNRPTIESVNAQMTTQRHPEMIIP